MLDHANKVTSEVTNVLMNVGRCPTCHKFLIGEELDSHRCTAQFQGIRDILIDHYYETHPDKDGHPIVFAKGLDGYTYRLVVCKHTPPHTAKRIFPDEDKPPDKLPVYPRGGVPLHSQL
jgi:hypothetical protein